MDNGFRRLLVKHPEIAIVALAAVAVPFLAGLGLTKWFYRAGATLRGGGQRRNPGVPAGSYQRSGGGQ